MKVNVFYVKRIFGTITIFIYTNSEVIVTCTFQRSTKTNVQKQRLLQRIQQNKAQPTFKYTQMHTNTHKYTQIHTNIYQYTNAYNHTQTHKYTGVLNSLSEQQLVDCSTAEGDLGCDGMFFLFFLLFVLQQVEKEQSHFSRKIVLANMFSSVN